MEKQAIKDVVYGGLIELIHNRRYFYHSSLGSTYSRLTEDGEKAVIDYMNTFGYRMIEYVEIELNQRAKNLVIEGLKGEKV